MTDSRAAADPYTTSFETVVSAIQGRDVRLDTTYFYPEGGGQPADRGTIGDVAVTDVQKTADGVVHTLAEAPPFDVGATVAGSVDPAFRTYCMRAHTASHVLYGAGRRLLDDIGYGGFGITPEKVRVDLSTPTDIDDAVLVELERLANRAVWDSRAVTWETHPEAEALAMPAIAFNTKTEEGLAGESVRVVTVEDWDVAACGGTHVSNTREIGPVSVLDRSNPGEGLTRVEFAVGPAAIDHRTAEKRAVLGAARRLGSAPADVPAEVDRLLARVDDLRDEVAALEDRVVEARIAELREEAVERDGDRWIVGAVSGLDANALGERAQALAGEAADVVALVGADGRAFAAVAAEGPDASEVVAAVTDEFGGGGGGSPRFAQCGGLDADPADVVAFLRG